MEVVLPKHCIKQAIQHSITQYKLSIMTTKILVGVVVLILTKDAVVTFWSNVHEKTKIHDTIVNFWISCQRVVHIKGSVFAKRWNWKVE